MKLLITSLGLFVLAIGILHYLGQRSAQSWSRTPQFSNAEYNRHYAAKQAALERILGPMYDLVGHSMIPFFMGGATDLYYFPNGIPGTGFATMELIEPDGSGPKPNRIGTYELVAFTKLKMPPKGQGTKDDAFSKIQSRICGIFTVTGRCSYEDILNPGDTSEIPQEDGEPTICLVFDEYSPNGIPFGIEGKRHCLLLCIEVFRSEMEYAMKNGSEVLLDKLKEAGYYPYSDLDRKPVF